MVDASAVAVARGARKREQTRQRVLDAAEVCMAGGGGTFRMEDVAARAGVAPASVYAHFGGRDVLVGAVLDRLLEAAEQSLSAAYSAPGDEVERFEAVGRTFMDLLLAHPALSRFVLSVGESDGGPGSPPGTSARLGRLRRGFERTIQAAIDVGAVAAVDARLLSFSLLSTWVGTAALGLRADELRLEEPEIRAALEQTMRTLTSGLRP